MKKSFLLSQIVYLNITYHVPQNISICNFSIYDVIVLVLIFHIIFELLFFISDAMAIVQHYGRPTFFITMTASSDWVCIFLLCIGFGTIIIDNAFMNKCIFTKQDVY